MSAFFSSNEEKEKKSYTVNRPDYYKWAVYLFLFSVGIYLVARIFLEAQLAASFLFVAPSIVGFILLYVMLPFRILYFIISEITLRVLLFHVPKKIPKPTVIIIGKNRYLKPSFWVFPNYDMDLLFIVWYLWLKKESFSIYYDSTIKTIDKVMADKRIKTVYFVGHGRRHGFSVDMDKVLDYCRYASPKYHKKYVYQIHCNGGKGKSLPEYVVPRRNLRYCYPEHGYMTNNSIADMFIDKILDIKGYTGFKLQVLRGLYHSILLVVPSLVVFAGLIFIRVFI